MKKFWTVAGYTNRYTGLKEAMEFASKQAEKYPGTTFPVLEAVYSVECPINVQVNPIEE